jgi:hypothetical protein
MKYILLLFLMFTTMDAVGQNYYKDWEKVDLSMCCLSINGTAESTIT